MTSSPISNLPDTVFRADGREDAATLIVLAHGAGAAMDTPFMDVVAQGLGVLGHRVLRFEFPYMQRRRQTGVKAPPDRAPVLLAHWRKAYLDAQKSAPKHCQLLIGGKSMGGRIASMLADDLEVTGLICLGYPFHPPGKPEKLRVAHLETLQTPSLILQGDRDPMGRREEVSHYPLSAAINLHWLVDGDHSLKPRKASGETEAGNLNAAIRAIDGFIRDLNVSAPFHSHSRRLHGIHQR